MPLKHDELEKLVSDAFRVEEEAVRIIVRNIKVATEWLDLKDTHIEHIHKTLDQIMTESDGHSKILRKIQVIMKNRIQDVY